MLKPFWVKKRKINYTGAEISSAVSRAEKLPVISAFDSGKALTVDAAGQIVASDSVSLADQLASTISVEDKVPYVFRTAGGSNDIGNRMNDTVVGGTIAWNQGLQAINSPNWAAETNATATFTGGVAEFVSTTNGFGIQTGGKPISKEHVYLMASDIKASENCSAKYLIGGTAGTAATVNVTTSYTKQSKIIKTGSSVAGSMYYIEADSTSINKTIYVKNAVVFDLTQMFGSSIANALRLAELSEAGLGVNAFLSIFPKSYYAYNTGELISVKTSAHETVGFNAFNYADGTAELIGGKQYQITGAYTALAYEDINGDAETITPDSSGLFTPTNNGTLTVTGGDSTTTCVHLTWSGYRNGEYAAYEKHTYALDSSLTLRGILKNDANGLYFDGDTYKSDGTVTRKYKYYIFDGSSDENWTLQSVNTYGIANFAIQVDLANLSSPYSEDIICNRFTQQTSSIAVTEDEGFMLSASEYFYIRIKSSTASTVSDFKTWLSNNNTEVVYRLAASTTETADEYTNPQMVDDFGTERYVVPEQSGVEMPVGHDTFYLANLRDKLQHLPDLAAADGTYLIEQDDNEMALTPYVAPRGVPDAPTTDGTYVLTATVSGDTVTYTWESST